MIGKIKYSVCPSQSSVLQVFLAFTSLRSYSFDGFGAFFQKLISNPVLIYFMQTKMVSVLRLTEDLCLAEMDQSNSIKCNVITDQTFTTTGYRVSCGVAVDLQKTIASGQTNYFSPVTFGVCGCSRVCLPSLGGLTAKSDPVTHYLCTCTILLNRWHPSVYFSDNFDTDMKKKKSTLLCLESEISKWIYKKKIYVYINIPIVIILF